uniref:Anoctamin n=1 Tax=Rhabditophanes sp. KR3021 TaxID=114890 RepID=A0AC35UH45_9BILA
MSSLKRSNSCWMDEGGQPSAEDLQSQDCPPLKKVRSLNAVGAAVKNTFKNFSFSKCKTTRSQSFNVSRTRITSNSSDQPDQNLTTDSPMNITNANLCTPTQQKSFATYTTPINSVCDTPPSLQRTNGEFEDKFDLEETPRKCPASPTASHQSATSFDVNFLQGVIGDSEPGEAFRKEQFLLTRQILGNETYDSDTDPHNLSDSFDLNDSFMGEDDDDDVNLNADRVFLPERNGSLSSNEYGERSPDLSMCDTLGSTSNLTCINNGEITDDSTDKSSSTIARAPSDRIRFRDQMRIIHSNDTPTLQRNTNIDIFQNNESFMNGQERADSIVSTNSDMSSISHMGAFNIENQNLYDLDNAFKIGSPNQFLTLKSILKKQHDTSECGSHSVFNKSVRWKESNEEITFDKTNNSTKSSSSPFDFQRLLNALREFARKSKNAGELSDEPIVIERDHTLKRRIILLPRNPSSILKYLNFKTLKTMLEKTYKYKVFFKYVPRKMSKHQWRRVDLIFVDSLSCIDLNDYKTKNGSAVDVTKNFPMMQCGIEGDMYSTDGFGDKMLVYQFAKNDIKIGQTFCDHIKSMIERYRFNRPS